ncbi:ChaC-domain-containing protein [Westerdykella ornata]|uniref:glutathione-specific gamma-glutamylcyclotransferase n=1 Tax=Westerdykella ornata TaxID=318751 RepID=A0A6A6JYZ6_WESOR|nr:ChaC-domain-containing protein [Westerdykella ornata]KAF2281313.1 ChaC-domain-containing protein [Westerdykella ornata]
MLPLQGLNKYENIKLRVFLERHDFSLPAIAEMTISEHEKEIAEFGKNDDFWIFGYGSLIWKPPPHYDKRVPGYIEGYVRRFWQASEDHRGTPSSPGRVVTLIDHAHWLTLRARDAHPASERVWGAAYHIPTHHVAEVREYLDLREINGYSIQFTPFHPASSVGDEKPATTPIRCLVYIGLPSNPQFVGPQDPRELARHILQSRGPSGENREYLYMLEEGLKGLSGESGDEHVADLVRECRRIEREEGAREEVEVIGVPLHRKGSVEEQEEVEKLG